MSVDFVIRRASEADAAAISRIYNSYVLHSITTFETDAVGPEDMRKRIQEKLDRYDWVIGELNEEVIGYAYYGPFRPRPAYRHTAESTIYVAEGNQGNGFGKKLYAALLKSAGQKDFRELIGVIALPNAASVSLHAALGFKEMGILRRVGYKFGAYIDVALWQNSLDGAAAAPRALSSDTR